MKISPPFLHNFGIQKINSKQRLFFPVFAFLSCIEIFIFSGCCKWVEKNSFQIQFLQETEFNKNVIKNYNNRVFFTNWRKFWVHLKLAVCLKGALILGPCTSRYILSKSFWFSERNRKSYVWVCFFQASTCMLLLPFNPTL